MTTVNAVFPNATINNTSQVLNDIHKTNKNIAIYQRALGEWRTSLAKLVNGAIHCRVSGTSAEISVTLSTYFTNELPGQEPFLADVLQLLEHFEQVTQASSFRLLLATVDTNMCRRFHTDINSLRMLCTYVGPGTLWVPDEAVDQTAYQKGSGNAEIVLDESLVQQASPGDVVILKGALYPGANPILHRSPSVEKDGLKRLLLRIDTNETQNMWS